MKTITYYYRGQIERGKNYKRVDGYSANSIDGLTEYPWLSYRESQRYAKSRGCKALFVKRNNSAQ
jgi:hypothetical protein